LFCRATEGGGHSASYGRHNEQRGLYIGKDGTYRFAADHPPHIPRSLKSKSPPALDLGADYNISVPADIWDNSFEPESPPPLPTPSFDDSFDSDLKNARSEFDVTITPEKGFGKYTDSEHSLTDVSEDSQDPKAAKCLKEVSATIFQGTSSIPITILVTTPIGEIPDPLDTPPTLQRNAASFPLATLNSDQFTNVNPSLLMPPTDKQLDSRKLRKAQEFREIRKWLITFLNSKGNRFPRKLRLRMMDLYCIREFDLSPEIVAKFNAELQDEGVASEQQDEGMDDAQCLSILGAAFRSQIEEVTPRKEKVTPLPAPLSWARQSSPLKKSEAKKSEPTKPAKAVREILSSSPAKEELEMDLAPSWLGPLISTSSSSRDSVLSDQQFLKRASSAPNLQPSRPKFSTTDSTHSVPGLRPRGSTVVGGQSKGKRSGSKRGSFISGAFGAMKDAMSGRSSKREEKIQRIKS
jgi:hypothetical protein